LPAAIFVIRVPGRIAATVLFDALLRVNTAFALSDGATHHTVSERGETVSGAPSFAAGRLTDA
jgi:hypothetical protein